MINLIVDSFIKKGVEKIVYTSPQHDIFVTGIASADCFFLEDVRSAVFNAYGMAKITHKPVVVIVDEPYLASTYTGLTEAWFQRVNVIIIAINSRNVENSKYLNRCVDSTIFIEEPSMINEVVDTAFSQFGPVLLKVKQEINKDLAVDYSQIVKLIKSQFGDIRLSIYNSNIPNDEWEIIKPEYKYGVISKYVGQLLGGRDSVLCIPEELLSLDSNIFNFRDFPTSFKLFVKFNGGTYWYKYQKWLSQNGINAFVYEVQLNEDINIVNKTPFAVLVK